MDAPKIMPFGDHLEELRRRLIWSLAGLIPIFVGCLIFGGDIIAFLLQPLLSALSDAGEPTRLLATSPIETFAAFLKVSTIGALLVGTPWLILQLWLFIAPGLYATERRFVYFLIPFSAVLTFLGMAFLYALLLPVSLTFLIGFGSQLVETNPGQTPLPQGVTLPQAVILETDPTRKDLEALPIGSMWVNEKLGELRIKVEAGEVAGLRLAGDGQISQAYRVGEYISLVFMLALGIGIAFQLPLVLMLLSWVGILEAREITPYRRHVAFGCVIAGAILTPQDPWSLMLLAGALYMLFELGIVLMRFVPARAIASGTLERSRTDEPRDGLD
ncbi:MAG: twin-arginine translocase subunit TatC [Planctomycetota bacterium]